LRGDTSFGAGAARPAGGGGGGGGWVGGLGARGGRAGAVFPELFGWGGAGGACGVVGPGAEHGIGGGIGAGGEARWATVYASVADVEATLAGAESLGATRLYGPNQVDDHTE